MSWWVWAVIIAMMGIWLAFCWLLIRGADMRWQTKAKEDNQSQERKCDP